jgi:putative colanic acid biosynthesis UDP-glucose lipid carrier transferase
MRPTNNRGLIRPYEAELEFGGRLADAGCIAVALWATTSLVGEPWGDTTTIAALAAMLLFYLCAQLTGLYRLHRGAPLPQVVRAIWIACTTTFLVLIMVGFVTKTSAEHSRRVILTWALLAPATLTLFRAGLALAAQELRARGHNTRTVAIVGMSELGQRLAARIEAAPWMGVRQVGFYDDRGIERLGPKGGFDYPLLGGFGTLVQGAKNGEIDCVYIALPPRAEPRIVELMGRLSDTTASVHLAYDFGGFDLLRAQWSAVGDIPVMAVVENPFYGSDGVFNCSLWVMPVHALKASAAAEIIDVKAMRMMRAPVVSW